MSSSTKSFMQESRQLNTAIDLQNISIFDYVINHDVPRQGKVDIDFLATNPNMNVWDGYGTVDATAIDTESRLKLDASSTHGRSRNALSVREFYASPGMATSAATFLNVQEMPLERIPSERTDAKSVKGRTAEASFGELRRTPLVPMMQDFISNDVPVDGFVSIGQPSKYMLETTRIEK